MRLALFIAKATPYALFLLLVLVPVGLVSYSLAAIVRTAKANWRSGWNDHE